VLFFLTKISSNVFVPPLVLLVPPTQSSLFNLLNREIVVVRVPTNNTSVADRIGHIAIDNAVFPSCCDPNFGCTKNQGYDTAVEKPLEYMFGQQTNICSCA
jgi:hypothetical protein